MESTVLECLLDEKQAAAYLSISVGTLRRWRRIGEGPAFARLGKSIRYRLLDLDLYLHQSTVRPDAPEAGE